MADRFFNVLFLCTHNSARSVMAEAILNKMGAGRFRAFSAGSHPKSSPNPFALEQVEKLGFDRSQFKSKSWEDFAVVGGPEMDIIITVCDNAAGEVCPVWIGHPATAHWGFPDPSDTEGDDQAKRVAFERVFQSIKHRIQFLVSLPIDKLEHLALANALKKIHVDAATAGTNETTTA
ncbi:MAG: arsenate reductase ArsC [Burkholderiales bacterium]|nr:arsenate reductase ArsC [Betaproteobacteria bacterium]